MPKQYHVKENDNLRNDILLFVTLQHLLYEHANKHMNIFMIG